MAKLALIFTIVANFCVGTALAQSDTAKLRKEVLALLKKYGITSFQLNVTSNNQSGGQTAFSITNNYLYVDPNYVPDSLNLIIEYVDEKKNYLAISPKSGSWVNPFVIYPDVFIKNGDTDNIIHICGGGIEMPVTVTGYVLYKNRKYHCSAKYLKGFISTKDIPACIPFTNENSFFIFGDCLQSSDQNKWYVYDYGKIYWFKNDRNIELVK